MPRPIKTLATMTNFGRSVEVLLFTESASGGYLQAVQCTQMVDVAEGDRIEEPTLKLSVPEAQELVDTLAKLGIRARDSDPAQGKAMAAHLDDMRRIAFGLLADSGVECKP